MSDDRISDERRQAQFKRWDELGLDSVKYDMISNGGHALVGSDRDVLELAWAWIKSRENAPKSARRDMDLIRGLLLEIEAGAKNFQTMPLDPLERIRVAKPELTEKRGDHIHLMQTAGLIEVTAENRSAGLMIVRGLTWKGHDLIDSIRDPKIWEKTKHGALTAGGFTVDLLRDLAKGFIRMQIEERTGIKL